MCNAEIKKNQIKGVLGAAARTGHYTTATHYGIWGRSPLLLMSLVEERCVLPELTVWSCLQSDGLPSAAELFGHRCPHLELSS